MGADLIATALPELSLREYHDAIDNANPQVIATAVAASGRTENLGDDAAFNRQLQACWYDEDQGLAIDLIAAQPHAVAAARAAAKSGARYVWTQLRRGGGAFLSGAARYGGPDLIIVGGSTVGDPPFAEFHDVALLAAILAAR